MLPVQTTNLAAAFTDAVRSPAPADAALPAVRSNGPKVAAHGDLACNVAMQVARALRAIRASWPARSSRPWKPIRARRRWWPRWRSPVPA